jgi:hypothetical protein
VHREIKKNLITANVGLRAGQAECEGPTLPQELFGRR